MIDPNDSWVFHILGDDTGKSAVWVAQRVPTDHVCIVYSISTNKAYMTCYAI